MKPLRAAFALAAPALLAACQGKPAGDSYFPLEAGHQWQYEMRTERENGSVQKETLVLSTLGEQSIEGGPAWRRRSDSGVEYWLRSDAAGVWRVASKTDLEDSPRLDTERRWVLKAPLAAGTEWQALTTAYVLERRADYPREIRHTHKPVPMTYTIEATGQALETPAGRFADCLRVQGRAAMRLYADPVVGWKDMPLATTEWYCKGVGLARLVRDEPASSNFLSGGKVTMELTQWQ